MSSSGLSNPLGRWPGISKSARLRRVDRRSNRSVWLVLSLWRVVWSAVQGIGELYSSHSSSPVEPPYPGRARQQVVRMFTLPISTCRVRYATRAVRELHAPTVCGSVNLRLWLGVIVAGGAHVMSSVNIAALGQVARAVKVELCTTGGLRDVAAERAE